MCTNPQSQLELWPYGNKQILKNLSVLNMPNINKVIYVLYWTVSSTETTDSFYHSVDKHKIVLK